MNIKLNNNEGLRIEHLGKDSRFNFIDIFSDGGLNSSTLYVGSGDQSGIRNVLIIKFNKAWRQIKVFNFASQAWLDEYDFKDWKDAEVIFDSRGKV